MDFKGKVCIVTGSSAGVGAATALSLARMGASVVINYSRSSAPAEAVASQCREAGADVLVVRADVARDEDCRALAAAAMERWGRIDLLVNNAGTTKFIALQNLAGVSADDFHSIYSVNTIGVFQMVRACEAALRASRGAVVNVSSIAGQDGVGSSIPYMASKGALNAMTIALARALGPEVRVNAVLPGFIETEWLRNGLGDSYQKAYDAYRAQSALEAVMSPEDVAEAIIALAGAGKVTGQLLRVDAGKGVGRAAPGRPV